MILAGLYICAVVEKVPPAWACREMFGLTGHQWQARRAAMTRAGWLPADDGSARFDEAWLDVALDMFIAKAQMLEAAREGAPIVEAMGAQRRAERAEDLRKRRRSRALAKQAELSRLVFDIFG